MYEMDDVVEIIVHHWIPDDWCTHVLFKDGWDYCSDLVGSPNPDETDD